MMWNKQLNMAKIIHFVSILATDIKANKRSPTMIYQSAHPLGA